jgi:hypothetical protein
MAWVRPRLCKLQKKDALDSQPQVIKNSSCLPMVGGSLRLPPPLKLVATNSWNIVESGVKAPKIKSIKLNHLLYNSSTICTIHVLYNYSTIHLLYNSSTIHLLYNSSIIHLLYNSSTIQLLYNSSTIHLLYNSSTIHLLYNSSTIHLLYNSSTIILSHFLDTKDLL